MENETKMFWRWTLLITLLSILTGLGIRFGNPFSDNLVLGYLFWFLGMGLAYANLAAILYAYIRKPYLAHTMFKLGDFIIK